MQAKESQKQAKGEAEGNGVLLCVCIALLVGTESCHMSRFVLLCSSERETVARDGLLCFILLCFVLLVRGEGCHMSRFALHCSALLCIALHGSSVE